MTQDALKIDNSRQKAKRSERQKKHRVFKAKKTKLMKEAGRK